MKLIPAVCAVLVGFTGWWPGVAAQTQGDAQKARRCTQLAGVADYYLTRRGEGSGGPNMIVLGARLDCEKGAYDKGIATLEKLLTDKRIPLPPAP